jgi:hypothetical protein
MHSIDSSITNLLSTEEELCITMTAIANAVLQLKETNEDSSQSLNDTADRLRNHMDKQNMTQTSTNHDQTNSSASPRSYAAAMQAHIPLAHASAIGRHSKCSHQVIIQLSQDALDSFRNLTKLEVVAKATLAFKAITQNDPPTPLDFRFVSAKKLTSSSLILELHKLRKYLFLNEICSSVKLSCESSSSMVSGSRSEQTLSSH